MSPELLAASKDFSATLQEELQTLVEKAAELQSKNAELEAKVARWEAQLAGAQNNSQAASAKVAVQHVHPSGYFASDQRSTPGLIVCSESGAAAATALAEELGAGWELHSTGETPDEKRVASAMALVVILSLGSLDSLSVVFALRCLLIYSKYLPHVLVHMAESCEFTDVMPREGTELADLKPLYNKVHAAHAPLHSSRPRPLSSLSDTLAPSLRSLTLSPSPCRSLDAQIAVTFITCYASYDADIIRANIDDQLTSDEQGDAAAEAADSSKSEDELAEMQRELLAGAPQALKVFGLGFSLFLSHRRKTGQGAIGRIYGDLKEDYRCFLDSEVTFKLHNLRALVGACNYFLFFLSEGILDNSPFCLEELLSAIHTKVRRALTRAPATRAERVSRLLTPTPSLSFPPRLAAHHLHRPRLPDVPRAARRHQGHGDALAAGKRRVAA